MQITASQQGPATVIALTGSVDALTASEAGAFLSAQVREGATRVILDLSGVDYMTSTGLRVILVTLHETRQAGGDLRLAAAQEDVLKVLSMSGFTSIIKNYPDVAAAVASFA